MTGNAPSTAPEVKTETEQKEKKSPDNLQNKAHIFIESGFQKLEEMGIPREFTLGILESIMGEEDGLISRFLSPIYNKEKVKVLKKDFDEVLKEGYEISDESMIAIYKSQKKNEDYKNKSFKEYLEHLKKNGKKDGDKWEIDNLDINGEIREQRKKDLTESIEKNLEINESTDFYTLLKGAATGEYNPEEIKKITNTVIDKQEATEDEKKSLREIFVKKIIGKEIIKMACKDAIQKKFKLEEIVITDETEMRIRTKTLKPMGIKNKSGEWHVSYLGRSVALNSTPDEFLPTLASENIEDIENTINKDSKGKIRFIERIKEDLNLKPGIVVDSEKKPVIDTEENTINTGSQDVDSDTESAATPETSQKTTQKTRKGRRDAAKSIPDTDLGPAA